MLDPMQTSWLAALPHAAQWADLTSPELATRRPTLALLPIFGVADHGTGQALDLEETLGSALVDTAVAPWGDSVRVLPPLRQGPAPFSHTYFKLELDTTRSWLFDLALSLQASTVNSLVLFVTSPWHEEWVSACAVDLREEFGLSVYLVSLRSLGLDLHPEASERATTATVAAWLGAGTATWGESSASGRSTLFRPGLHAEVALPPPPSAKPAEQAFLSAARALHEALAELLRLPARPLLLPTRPVQPFGGSYRNRYLPALTTKQMTERVRPAESLLVIPLGAIEQHGPHLPLAVDAVLGQAFLAAAEAHLPAETQIWIAPPFLVGRSNEHLGFPGTLSVSTSTLQQLVVAAVTEAAARGFRRIAFLNTHGGNSAVLVPTLRELQERLGVRAGVIGGLFRPDLAEPEKSFGIHAGEWETSLYLAIAPNQVRTALAVRDFPPGSRDGRLVRQEKSPVTQAWLTRDLSSSGVLGDATQASAEKGQAWLKEVGRTLADRLLALRELPV